MNPVLAGLQLKPGQNLAGLPGLSWRPARFGLSGQPKCRIDFTQALM